MREVLRCAVERLSNRVAGVRDKATGKSIKSMTKQLGIGPIRCTRRVCYQRSRIRRNAPGIRHVSARLGQVVL